MMKLVEWLSRISSVLMLSNSHDKNATRCLKGAQSDKFELFWPHEKIVFKLKKTLK